MSVELILRSYCTSAPSATGERHMIDSYQAPSRTFSHTLSIVLWIATLVAGLGIAVVGAAKFGNPREWQRLFVGWGYPAWMSYAVGAAELIGAVALLIPRFALTGVLVLGVVMTGALITLLLHRGGPMGWGATPAIYLLL